MPWNEPGKNKDPWGQKNNDAPPDLDEVLTNLKKKVDAMFGGNGGSSNGSGNGSQSGGAFAGLIGLILLVFWAFSGLYIIDEGWRGVVTQFGAKSEVTLPGPHIHLPWPIETVEKVDVEGLRTTTHNAQMLTKDENIISLSLSVQYNVSDVQLYAYEVRDPDVTLKQAVETAIREVVGGNEMDYILTDGRAEVTSRTKVIMQQIIDSYKVGLNVVSVNLNEAQPPEQVQDAFADAIKAREDEQRIINEANAYRNDVVPKARGDAQSMLEEAEAYRTRVLKSSQGETSRFLQLLTEYEKAPEVTRDRLYIDMVEEVYSNSPKIMVDVEDGNNLMYLPLNQILTGQRSKASASSLSRSSSSASTSSVDDDSVSIRSSRTRGTR